MNKEQAERTRFMMILDVLEIREAFEAMLTEAKRDRVKMTRLGASSNMARIDGWIAGIMACRSVIDRLVERAGGQLDEAPRQDATQNIRNPGQVYVNE